MQENKELMQQQVITLNSPDGTLIYLKIQVKESQGQSQPAYVFTVTSPDFLTQGNSTHTYYLPGKDHLSYLNFFEKLARDFNLRMPQNKRESIAKPAFNAPLQAILTTNDHPDIWYGYGDPAVIQVEGENPGYYLVVTSNDAPHSFPLLRSRDLQTWEFLKFIFPAGHKPEWAADGELISDYWAPEIHQFKNEFRVYFVARDKNTRELCIGTAKANSTEDLFVPDKAPILKGNVIDPHVYVQDDETAYLYWKEDNNAIWPGRLLDLLYQQPGLITSV